MRRAIASGVVATLIILNPIAHAESPTETSITGPSTTTPPYLKALASGVSFTSLLTAGDQVGQKPDGAPWRMVGTPDGLGAFDNGDGTITVLMNHELNPTDGVKRTHGAAGAFVSRLVIDKQSLRVVSGADLIKTVKLYNRATKSYEADTAALGNLCSGDLAEGSAFYDADSKLGYDGRIFLSGEEKKKGGRAFAHIVTGDAAGTSYELAWLGKMAFENLLAHPRGGRRTIVAMSDDTRPVGQIYFYVGEKQAFGEPVEKAGLAYGRLYGLKLEKMPLEPTDKIPETPARFTLVELENAVDHSGDALDAQSHSKGVTEFQRPEDGAWDRPDTNRFYFNTTAAFDLPSRVWAVDFDDYAHPEKGGTLRMIYQTAKDQHMLDNMTVTDDGLLVLQEDPGDDPPYLARIYLLNPRAKEPQATPLAQHDPALFNPGGLTINEESSGVIDVTHLLGTKKQRAFLLDVQLHDAPPKGESKAGEIVDGGQLLLMRHDNP
jgi:hypothetical protein